MAEWVTLCASSELPPGSREVFGVGGSWIAVFNVDNVIYAIEDLCTHDGNTLAFDQQDRPSKLINFEIECPRHGGRFDIRDGSATRSPAEINTPWYKTRIDQDRIQILL